MCINYATVRNQSMQRHLIVIGYFPFEFEAKSIKLLATKFMRYTLTNLGSPGFNQSVHVECVHLNILFRIDYNR